MNKAIQIWLFVIGFALITASVYTILVKPELEGQHVLSVCKAHFYFL